MGWDTSNNSGCVTNSELFNHLKPLFKILNLCFQWNTKYYVLENEVLCISYAVHQDQEDIVMADIDMEYLDTVRAQVPVTVQRRNDMYNISDNPTASQRVNTSYKLDSTKVYIIWTTLIRNVINKSCTSGSWDIWCWRTWQENSFLQMLEIFQVSFMWWIPRKAQ